MLSVMSGDVIKKMFLKKGDAVFASSNSRDDWLGVALVKAGKITLKQFEHSTEVMKKSGRRHGAVLVELGYITPKEIFWAVKFQVREIVYSMFEYDHAGYEFAEGGIPEEVITLKMSMGSLIYEGVSRIDNLIRIKEELPSTWTILQLNDDPLRLFQGVQFSVKDKRILSCVDGKRTIKQVIEDSCLNNFEAMKIIYVFWAIGILTEKKSEVGNISVDVLFLKPFEEGSLFEAKVADMHGRLGEMGPREVLGVSEVADQQEIRNSYYRLAREFHPDRVFDSEDQHLRDKLVEIFAAVKNAYLALSAHQPAGEEALSVEPPEIFEAGGAGEAVHAAQSDDPEENGFERLIDESLYGPSGDLPEVSADPADPIVFGEIIISRQPADPLPGEPVSGEAATPEGPVAPLLSEAAEETAGPDEPPGPVKSENSSGIDQLREAVRLDPSDPAGWRRLGMALSEADAFTFSGEAEHAMLQAIGLDPLESDCYMELGVIYAKAGKLRDARRQFEKALVMNPGNEKAREQLERLGE